MFNVEAEEWVDLPKCDVNGEAKECIFAISFEPRLEATVLSIEELFVIVISIAISFDLKIANCFLCTHVKPSIENSTMAHLNATFWLAPFKRKEFFFN